MRAASPRDVIPRGFACVSFWASFGSRLFHWDRRPLWLGCAGDLRPALRPSARPWQSSWSAFCLCFCFRPLGGANPSARTSRTFCLGRGHGPTLVSPPTSVFSRFFGAARHSDRCRATALELAHSGHVMLSPPKLHVCVYAVYLLTNKNLPRFSFAILAQDTS